MHYSILLLAALGLASCKKEPVSTPNGAHAAAGTETPGETQESATAPGEQPAETRGELSSPAIKLLEQGKEPRRTLRSSVAPPRRQTLKIRVDNEIDALIGALQARQAPRSVTLELTVRTGEDVVEQGRAFSFTVDKARAVRTADIPPNPHKLRQEALAAMRGLRGSYRVDSLGMVREVVMNLPSGASGELTGLAEDLKWALRQLAAPLPSEPIGMGARWTASRGVEQGGVNASEVSTLEITKLQGQVVTITTKVQQSAEPQKFRHSGSTVDVVLTEFTGEGAGEITWNPIERVPRSAEMTSTVTKHTTFQSEGKRTNGMIVTRRTLTINGPRR